MQTIYKSAFYLKVNYQKHNNVNSSNKDIDNDNNPISK